MRWCSRLMVFWVVALAVLLGVRLPARAQGVIDMGGSMPDQEAKAHFKVGKSLYEAGRFAEAAAEWEQAYALAKKPELLYNVYVAYRDASDLPKAIDALQRYLDSAEVDPGTRINLQARLHAMQEANERSASPELEAKPAVVQAPAAPPHDAPAQGPARKPPASSQPHEGGGNVPSYVLLGAGAALVAVAVVTGFVASAKIKSIEDHCPNDMCPTSYDLSRNRRDAELFRDVSIGFAASGLLVATVGGALLLGGYLDEQRPAASPSATLGCIPCGCFGAVSSRF